MSESFFETRDRIRARLGRVNEAFEVIEHALERPKSETEEALEAAVRERYPRLSDNGPWTYVVDFHDDWVIVSIETSTEHKYVRLGYAWDDGTLVLGDTEEPVKTVRRWEKARAFATEVNGKTILTAPVSALRESAGANPLYLNISGRFVGAEKANRNGALWTTGDLEMGLPTVTHGPLNWLHEERHIVGVLAKSELITPKVEKAAVSEPYISVDSAVWKWIYPQESAVIEMASEQSSLWYSMECISEKIHCTDEECGGVYGYFEVMRAADEVCDHVKLKQVARRFENPTFLGGAVIVPPVRPGWADANASVMKQAASFAEKAWDQAGVEGTGLEAATWDRLMAQVIRFAS